MYTDPPWSYKVWSEGSQDSRLASSHYKVMDTEEIAKIPLSEVCADDCVLIMWMTWPQLEDALWLMKEWKFTYKTCAFCWIKGDNTQLDFFQDDIVPFMGMGYWARANSEAALLGTRGHPKRLDAGVRQAIVEPVREHSRKPDTCYERIERLVEGPYLEIFSRASRLGWTMVGNDVGKFSPITEGLNADHIKQSTLA